MNGIDRCLFTHFLFVLILFLLRKKAVPLRPLKSLMFINTVPCALFLPQIPTPSHPSWASHTGHWL